MAAALCALAATAQKTYNLSLEESIAIARKESYSMQSLELDAIIATNNLRAAKGQVRTNVSMNFTLPQYTQTMSEYEDEAGNLSFYSVKRLFASSDLTITQPLPTAGRIYVTSGLSGTNNYNSELRTATLRTRLGISQPIDALYGYNSVSSALKRAKLDYERSMKSIKREDLDLIYQVSASYYRLLSQEKGAEIARMNLDRQSEAYEISKNKYAAGLIREVEALQMEVDMAEARNSYDLAIQELASSRNSFKQLIGLEMNAAVNLRTDLHYKSVEVNEDKAVATAVEKRLEMRERDIQVELQKLSLKQQRAQRLPKISLEAYLERTGVNKSPEDIQTPYDKTMADIWNNIQERPADYSIGMRMSVPILDWGTNKSNVRSAEARLRQAELTKTEERRQIETEVKNLVASVRSSLSRLQLLEKNVAVAEKSFSITLQRFSDGDIDSQALALERNRLNLAQKSHLEAFITYQLGLSDLMRKTFYDFLNDRPIE